MGRGKSYTDDYLVTNLQEGDSINEWSERTGVSPGTLRNRVKVLLDRNMVEEMEPEVSTRSSEDSGRPAKRYRRVSAKSPTILREGRGVQIKGVRWTFDEVDRLQQLALRDFDQMPVGAQRYLNLADNGPFLFVLLLAFSARLPYDDYLKTRDALVKQGESTVAALEKRIKFIKEIIYSPQFVDPFPSGFFQWSQDLIEWLETHDPSFSTPEARADYLNLMWNETVKKEQS